MSPATAGPGRVVEEAASVNEILNLVVLGRGVAIVPATASRVYPGPGVAFVTITDAEPAALNLVWHASAETPCLRAFVTTVQRVTSGPGGMAPPAGSGR